MKRPLGLVALLYGGGLLMGEFFQPSLLLLFSISLALAGAAVGINRLRHRLIWPLILFAGWTNLAWRTAILSPCDLRSILTSSPEEATILGTLSETPTERIHVRDGRETRRTQARLRVCAIRREDHWQPARGRIQVSTRGALPAGFFAGEKVSVTGVIAPPRGPLAEGLFDYRTWLRRQDIHFELVADSPTDWELICSNSPPWSDRFLTWARGTLGRGLPAEDEPLQLLRAMTLGWRSALASEVYEPFVQSGTMHIFAISGLHIALICGILVSLLRVVQVSRAACGLVVIPLLWAYAGVTGWQPSAVRATIMMSIVIAGWSLHRPGNLLNSLAAAALVILLWEPQQLFQASFQLSFLVLLSIALALPPLELVRDRFLRTDPLLPSARVPRWQRWLGRPLRYLATGLATSTAAWLGSWPLTAHYFHLFSPVTLLANVLVVPLGSAALAAALGSLLCGAWFPAASVWFNHSAWFWMWLIMKVSRAATGIPGAFSYVRGPSPLDFVLYYGALIAVLSGFALRRGRRRWSAIAALGVALLCFLQWAARRGTVTLTVLPLNGGHSVYCDAPGRKADLLVDCGNADAVEFLVTPFLRAQGVHHLSCLALTHGDVRQMGGAGPLQQALRVRCVATSPVRFRSAAYRHLVAELEKAPDTWRRLRPGDRLQGWAVLHPDPEDRFARADDSALVLLGYVHGTRILLLSDLGRQGQEALLKRTPDLQADIVVAGLPDKSEPLCEGLLEAIRPSLILIPDSEYPATRRAGAALQRRLARRNVPVLYGREAGAVTIRLDAQGWEVETMSGRVASGKPATGR